MTRYIIRRFLILIPVLLGVSLIVFVLFNSIGGDPVRMMLGKHISPITYQNVRAELGLDKPPVIRYLLYLSDLVRGDLGRSYIQRREVLDILLDAVPVTFRLTIVSFVLAFIFGVPAGIIAALKKNTYLDKFTNIAALLGYSVPVFWLALIFQTVFGVYLKILPVSGIEQGEWSYYILPGLTLSLPLGGIYSRLVRASVLEVLGQPFILAVEARGLPYKIMIRHVLKNALIPLVTEIGYDLGFLLGGALIIETIFSLPGLGRVMITAVGLRDFPLVMGGTIMIAFFFVVISALVDILYAWLNPKLRSNL